MASTKNPPPKQVLGVADQILGVLLEAAAENARGGNVQAPSLTDFAGGQGQNQPNNLRPGDIELPTFPQSPLISREAVVTNRRQRLESAENQFRDPTGKERFLSLFTGQSPLVKANEGALLQRNRALTDLERIES